MTPFLKWAGGKRWLVTRHPSWFRRDAKRYIEPFLGSGAVYFHIQPKRANLSDLNGELISTYEALRDEPLEVSQQLMRHQRMHSSEHYYRVRDQKPTTRSARAARFIYLNRTCFNGLYRVNLQGTFNVPKGTKDRVILPTDDFESISRLLRYARLDCCDFATAIDKAEEGDFLYVDPPYTVRHNVNNFTKYNERIFTWSDQERLADHLARAASRGVSILISNADHPCIHKLYSAGFWQHISVGRFSGLASSVKHRKETTETVISNYLDEKGEQGDPRS